MKKLADIQEGLWLHEDPKHGLSISLQNEDRMYRLCSVPREDPKFLGEADPLREAMCEIVNLGEEILDDNFGGIMQGIFDYLKERYSW